ncbi:lasso peptide biosynthesis PqqD family chaperone [Actinosynnema sp. CS-041913]|uniref:lasso peptide biosynthesis PqqD family chaperone n=1 Tax=Actinosynnema sp. CS-041913 TaxID=3239917 RepID=UPI003D8B2BE7
MNLLLREDVSLTATDDGSGVLLDERSGQYWQLNPSGFTTLRLLLDGRDEQSVAATLVGESGDVSLGRAVLDVRELADQLVAADLVVRR